jgi:hypothetical protein
MTTSGLPSALKSATPQKPSLTVAAVQSTLPLKLSPAITPVVL